MVKAIDKQLCIWYFRHGKVKVATNSEDSHNFDIQWHLSNGLADFDKVKHVFYFM